MRTQWLFCGWLAALPATLPAAASTFNIAPIRAELGVGHRTEALTLTNVEDEPVVIDVRVVAWSQRNGEEQLDETRELLVTPPVLQIPAKGEQIIRVALRREADPVKELTYRVIFEEVPQAAPVTFNGLRVALRLSVPVFVAPSHGRAAPDVAWDAHALPDGGLQIAATNRGTGHLQISDFDMQWPGVKDELHGMTSKYVLPGSRITWTLKPGEPIRAGGSIQGPRVIHGRSDQGEFTADVAETGL